MVGADEVKRVGRGNIRCKVIGRDSIRGEGGMEFRGEKKMNVGGRVEGSLRVRMEKEFDSDGTRVAAFVDMVPKDDMRVREKRKLVGWREREEESR